MMRLHSFLFPDELMTELKDLSKKTGAPMSELLRRATKEYIKKIKQNHEKASK
jgi:predicted DNA-binding protein